MWACSLHHLFLCLISIFTFLLQINTPVAQTNTLRTAGSFFCFRFSSEGAPQIDPFVFLSRRERRH